MVPLPKLFSTASTVYGNIMVTPKPTVLLMILVSMCALSAESLNITAERK